MLLLPLCAGIAGVGRTDDVDILRRRVDGGAHNCLHHGDRRRRGRGRCVGVGGASGSRDGGSCLRLRLRAGGEEVVGADVGLKEAALGEALSGGIPLVRRHAGGCIK